jgi:phosphoribosyl 1,2-cyclic phosphodiesterase
MGLDPQKVRAVLVSHAHPDHSNDAEILVEAMTSGMTRKRGFLVAAHSVLSGNEVCDPTISKYHQQMPEKVIDAKPGTTFNIDDTKILAAKAKHSDPDAVGFRLESQEMGGIAYTSDTELFEGIGKLYEGVRLLILCTMRPSGEPWKGHMTTDDAIKIVEEAKPEKAVLTHFGMKMIFRGPDREAELIQQKTGVPTTAAVDGMHLSMGKEIQIQKSGRKQRGLEDFLKEA